MLCDKFDNMERNLGREIGFEFTRPTERLQMHRRKDEQMRRSLVGEYVATVRKEMDIETMKYGDV